MNTATSTQTTCIPRELQLQAAMYRLGTTADQIEAGYNILRKYHKTVTIFGSARLSEDSPYYQKARELGSKLAGVGYTVVTGGGPGIMEAANRGAFEAGGGSIGFNIKLPFEQVLNTYTTDSLTFSHFAPRKIVMTMMSDAYIYFPGGFGTLDELTEILTLIQTQKTQKAPVILYDRRFWSKLEQFIAEDIDTGLGLISPEDKQLYTVTENLDEIIEVIEANKTYCGH